MTNNFCRAPSFHMPQDISAPLILVGPGSGIAPFRGFWQHRRCQIDMTNNKKHGSICLLFGCRYRGMDLYRDEKEQAVADGILTKSLLALSREDNVSKVNKIIFLYSTAPRLLMKRKIFIITTKNNIRLLLFNF